MEFEELIDILEASVKKNGPDKPLTIGHLLNILKMVQKNLYQEDNPEEYPYCPYSSQDIV